MIVKINVTITYIAKLKRIANLFIESQSTFEKFLAQAQKSEYLAIDTEFLREKTYWPKLCLLQMAIEGAQAIVDPFKLSDMTPLASVLNNRRVVKIFHAGTQDIEILLHETGTTPKNIFDTQVAATLIGSSQQIGYGGLVQSVCGVHLKKEDSFTDWSRRPLTQSQIDYAGDDVAYLPQLYHKIKQELQSLGRLDWLTDDFRQMEDPKVYEPDPRNRWRHLKRVSRLNRKQMAIAREVAAWRENRAQAANVPRKWVMTDEQVIEVCKRAPQTIDQLFMVRGLSDKMSTKEARELVSVVEDGLNVPEQDWPKPITQHKNGTNVDEIVDLMTAMVRKVAKENNIAAQTLASHSDLVELARGHDAELLHGWRKSMIGNDLVDLRDGKLGLSVHKGHLMVEPL